jgi:predicted O-methyltransferase YrrM
MSFRSYIGLVQKYGIADFSKIAAERFLRQVTRGAVSAFFFKRAIRNGQVYFGEHLGARQGVLQRHFFMYRLACREIRNGSRPFQVLEVGSYAGASAITWALAIKTRSDRAGQVLCVDPWRNYLTEDDVRASATPDVLRDMASALESGQVFALFDHNVRAADVSNLVRPLRGRFDELAASIPESSCDIVYIDANHQYPAVIDDLTRAARLVRNGGILCGDDLELQWPSVNAEYCGQRISRDLIIDPASKQFVHPGVSKAVWDFFGCQVSAWNGFWAMRKVNENLWEPVLLSATFRHSELPPHLKWWRTKIRSQVPLKPQPHVPPYSTK